MPSGKRNTLSAWNLDLESYAGVYMTKTTRQHLKGKEFSFFSVNLLCLSVSVYDDSYLHGFLKISCSPQPILTEAKC